jgi:hypothetical protein
MRPPTDRLALIVPARPGMTADAHRQLVEQTVGVALCIVGMIRDADPAETAEFHAGLTDDQRAILPFLIAAMVDVAKTARQLYAWTSWRQPIRYDGATAVSPESALLGDHPRSARSRECGSQGGWTEHRDAREAPCDRCRIAHDAWKSDRQARTRRQRRGCTSSPRRPARRPVHLVAVQAELFPREASRAA